MDPVRGNNRRVMVLLTAAVLTAAGCATEFEQRLAEAETLRERAAAAGAEWLETGRLLDRARAEEAQGNTELALELVATARFQAEMAIRQAEHEAEAWKQRVLR